MTKNVKHEQTKKNSKHEQTKKIPDKWLTVGRRLSRRGIRFSKWLTVGRRLSRRGMRFSDFIRGKNTGYPGGWKVEMN